MEISEGSDHVLVVLLVLTDCPDEQNKGFRTQRCRSVNNNLANDEIRKKWRVYLKKGGGEGRRRKEGEGRVKTKTK